MGWMGIITLLIVAAIADGLSLVPFVGTIVAPIFWVCVSAYLWLIGCGIFNVRRLVTSIISMIAEMIPAIQALPLIFVGTVIVIILVRIEDMSGKKLMSKISPKSFSNRRPHYDNGQRLPRAQQIESPINVDGIRAPRGGLN